MVSMQIHITWPYGQCIQPNFNFSNIPFPRIISVCIKISIKSQIQYEILQYSNKYREKQPKRKIWCEWILICFGKGLHFNYNWTKMDILVYNQSIFYIIPYGNRHHTVHVQLIYVLWNVEQTVFLIIILILLWEFALLYHW